MQENFKQNFYKCIYKFIATPIETGVNFGFIARIVYTTAYIFF